MPPSRKPFKKGTRPPPRRKKSGPRKAPAPKRKIHKRLPAPPPPAPAENEAAHQLALRIARMVSDKKAEDVVVLDVRGLTSYADYFVVASGESERQVGAMAEHVRTSLKKDGLSAVGTEGEQGGNWVLLDYGEVVTHLFYTETRGFYDLEGLWADAPREKVG